MTNRKDSHRSKPAFSELLVDLSQSELRDLHTALLHAVAGTSTDKRLADLIATLARTSDDLPSLYQLNAAIRINHSMFDEQPSFVRAENEFECDVVNWKDSEEPLEPFQTTVQPSPFPGVPAYSLTEYEITDPVTGKRAFGLSLGDMTHKASANGEETFTAKRVCRIPPRTTFHVIYRSTRIIPLHDTYMYTAQTRPSLDLVVTYRYSELAKELATRGVKLRPKLTVVSRTAAVSTLCDPDTSGRREWQLRGWLLLGNGLVLSW